jgi:hypothetical protein
MTSNIHLRCVDQKMMIRLKQEAKNRNMSVNKLILVLLKGTLGLSHEQTKIVHHDLDKFAGTWSKQEAKKFLKSIEYFEKIDEDLWS